MGSQGHGATVAHSPSVLPATLRVVSAWLEVTSPFLAPLLNHKAVTVLLPQRNATLAPCREVSSDGLEIRISGFESWRYQSCHFGQLLVIPVATTIIAVVLFIKHGCALC